MRPLSVARVLVVLVPSIVAAGGCASSGDAGEGAEAVESSLSHPELRRELLDLRRRDQDARREMVAAMQRAQRDELGRMSLDEDGRAAVLAVREIDAESTAFLHRMIDQHGWPTFDMVGEHGARSAWLLAQHADADPELQARVLELMEPLVARGQAAPDNFALLTDRVRLARGEPQVYGTQFASDERGVQRPRRTIDWSRVDERRASVGLSPMRHYAKTMREAYGEPVELTPLDNSTLDAP